MRTSVGSDISDRRSCEDVALDAAKESCSRPDTSAAAPCGVTGEPTWYHSGSMAGLARLNCSYQAVSSRSISLVSFPADAPDGICNETILFADSVALIERKGRQKK